MMRECLQIIRLIAIIAFFFLYMNLTYGLKMIINTITATAFLSLISVTFPTPLQCEGAELTGWHTLNTQALLVRIFQLSTSNKDTNCINSQHGLLEIVK